MAAGSLAPIVRRVQRVLAALASAQPCESPSAEQTVEILTWLREYIGQPHPDLGRKGPVCPFMLAALNEQSVSLAVDAADGSSLLRLRGTLLKHLRAFRERLRRYPEHSLLASTVLVFPKFDPRYYQRLDDLHSELKTEEMSRGVMLASFHPRSTRPAQHNPGFHVLRAPFAAFVYRKMVVHDILFLGTNRRAFAFYRSQFGHLHEKGQVSDEYGYATAFAEAVKRFGAG